MIFKKGDKVVVKQPGGKHRPAVFVGYDSSFSDICKVQYITKTTSIVFTRDVILESVFLSPLYETMREED